MNTYIILFILTQTNNLPCILLYGYGIPDLENDVRGWSEKKFGKKLDLCQISCVMSQEDLRIFEEKLEMEEEVQITDDISIPGKLRKRPETIFYPKEKFGKSNGSLLKSLSRVQEYWNTEKERLFDSIQEKYKGADAKKQRKKIHDVLEFLSNETSVHFLGNAAERLGNIEIYAPCKEFMNFKWKLDTNDVKLVLAKKNPCKEALIVNCILYNANRLIFNQITEWMPDVPSLEFEANEIISEVQISIWQKEQGQLIYYDKSYIYDIQLDTHVESNIRYRIHDKWTENLSKTFGGSPQKEDKLSQVRIKKKNDIQMSSLIREERNIWDDARYAGIQLAKNYAYTRNKGAFCKKIGEGECEIDSFLKIAEYLNDKYVKKAIIVDPYFSILAMEKMLTRIENEKLHLKIITSLSATDPDKEGAAAKNPNYLNEVRSFLKNNSPLIHQKLTIQNITHEGNTAIHDRYLLLIKSDSIEGYLLSNSINSAGKNYSFVIAPMDQEVTYEVLDYACEIADEAVQNKKNKRVRYQIETLWDSERNKKEEENSDSTIAQPQPWEQRDKKLKLEELFSEGWDLDEKMAEESILFLCWHLYYIHDLTMENCLEWMSENKINLQKLAEYGMKAAQKLEIEEALCEKNKINYSLVNMYRMALNAEKQEEISIDAEYIIRDIKEIYYDRYSYLYMLYRMLFFIDAKKTIEFMQKSQSPMAFKVMKENMLKAEYRFDIYQSIQNSELQWLSELAYYYFTFVLLRRMKRKEKPWELSVENYLNSHPQAAVFQYACWIKALTSKSNKNSDMELSDTIETCFRKLSEYLNKVAFTEEDRRMFICLFINRYNESINSKNIMSLWEIAEAEPWRTFLQEWAIQQLKKKWSDDKTVFHKADYSVTKCAAFMALQLWEDDIASMLNCLSINENALYKAICPVQYDINYDLWRHSVQKVLWQLLFLKYYCALWEDRKDVTDNQYQELLKLRNKLYKVEKQCERWQDLSGLVPEVFNHDGGKTGR